jgi:hypothetical protein
MPELKPMYWLFDSLNSKNDRSAKEAASSLHLHAEQQISDIGGAPLCFLFHHGSGLRRKLKYRCLLAFTKFCQENKLPVWKFQRIMVRPRLVLTDLSEDGRRVPDCLPPPSEESDCGNFNLVGKRKLGSRKDANRDGEGIQGREPPGAGAEVACSEFIADLCRTRQNAL